jgi:hypothetical protein
MPCGSSSRKTKPGVERAFCKDFGQGRPKGRPCFFQAQKHKKNFWVYQNHSYICSPFFKKGKIADVAQLARAADL